MIFERVISEATTTLTIKSALDIMAATDEIISEQVLDHMPDELYMELGGTVEGIFNAVEEAQMEPKAMETVISGMMELLTTGQAESKLKAELAARAERRDKFALAAMQTFLRKAERADSINYEELARVSYKVADAMLLESDTVTVVSGTERRQ